MDALVSTSPVAPALPDVVVAGPADLDYMAGNGHSARVFAVLRQLSPEERRACLTPPVLRQGVVGGLAHARSLPAEGAGRAAAVDLVGELVRSHASLSRRSPSRDLMRSLLDWGRFLFDDGRLAEAEQVLEPAAAAARPFPDLYARVVLAYAACLSARGDHAGAHAALDAVHRRPDLVADRAAIPEIAMAAAQAALLTGRVAEFKRSLFDGLRGFYASVPARRALFDQIGRAHRGRLRVLLGEATAADKLVFAGHGAAFLAMRALPPARRGLERALLGGVYAGRYLLRPKAAGRTEAPALVTRAMGGIGDLLMMTPGLHALSLRLGRPVHLAIPRRYFPVFDGNEDVRLLDIHQPLHSEGYRLWFNLTDCPAARSESLAVPDVRRNRIAIFARALGIRGAALRRLDRRPRYTVSAAERAAREAWIERQGLAGRRLVGVQARADESYRDYPHMRALVRSLAREHAVLVFSDLPLSGYDHANVVKVEGRGLREAFALAEACAVLVTPDSSFLHAGAALGVPTVSVFGPTDGRVRTSDYPLAQALDARRQLPCVPCWRNEDIPCALTGLKASVCLGEVGVAEVAEAVRGALTARS